MPQEKQEHQVPTADPAPAAARLLLPLPAETPWTPTLPSSTTKPISLLPAAGRAPQEMPPGGLISLPSEKSSLLHSADFIK
jgi:hypothetical protein